MNSEQRIGMGVGFGVGAGCESATKRSGVQENAAHGSSECRLPPLGLPKRLEQTPDGQIAGKCPKAITTCGPTERRSNNMPAPYLRCFFRWS